MSVRSTIRFWFDDLTTPMGRLVDFLVISLIVISCTVLVLETYAQPGQALESWAGSLKTLETVIIGLFVAEYLLRLWAAEHRWGHIFEAYSLIDLVAILPALMAGATHLQFFRLFRILRVMRLLRYLEDQRFFFGSIRQSHLGVLRVAFTIFAILFVSSGFIWRFEHETGQDLQTFGKAFYFSVVTLTTVGFGDMTPKTPAGQMTTVGMILAGVIFIPWQVRNLINEATRGTDENTPNCPRCGLMRHAREARFCQRCGERLVAGETTET